jgi:hypothetical protein
MANSFVPKHQAFQVLYIENTDHQYGVPTTTRQTLLVMPNGRSWVMPIELIDALVIAADDESDAFLQGLKERFAPQAPPSPTADFEGMRIKTTEDGFEMKPIQGKKK